MKKYIDLLLSKWKDIIIGLLLVSLAYGMYTITPKDGTVITEQVKITEHQVKPVAEIAKPVKEEKLTPKPLVLSDKPAPSCSQSQVEYLLKTNDKFMDNKNFFVVDLNSMRFIEDKITNSYYSKKPIYGVKYELQGKNQVYLMIYENIDELNYNKKYYERRHKVVK